MAAQRNWTVNWLPFSRIRYTWLKKIFALNAESCQNVLPWYIVIHSEQNCSYTLSVVPRFSNPLNLGRVSLHFSTKFFAFKWDCQCQATSGAKEEKIKIHNFLPQLLLLHVEVPWVSKVWLECLSFAWNHTKSVVEL